jgi:hypothetical protein
MFKYFGLQNKVLGQSKKKVNLHVPLTLRHPVLMTMKHTDALRLCGARSALPLPTI